MIKSSVCPFLAVTGKIYPLPSLITASKWPGIVENSSDKRKHSFYETPIIVFMKK